MIVSPKAEGVMKRFGVLLLLTVMAMVSVPATKADYVTYPPGCYVCKEHPSLLFYYEDCTQVGSGEQGDGIYCKEMQSLLVRYCQTSGGACEYIVVGGGTGGGGGGSSCGPTFGYCDVECFSCGGELY